MPNFRRFLMRRRLLAFLAAAALLFGLAMLHPYPRQALFGPTIRGQPWCVWEAEVRRFTHQQQDEDSFADKTLRWLGITRNRTLEELADDAEMLPLLLELAEDQDRDVRLMALDMIFFFDKMHDASALPVLRGRLDDNPECRLLAARAIWRIDNDKQVLCVFLRELNDPQSAVREHAMSNFLQTCDRGAPEFFPHILAYANDPDRGVRRQVMGDLCRLGKKAVPTLIQGLDDCDAEVRSEAALSLQILGDQAKDAVPALEIRLNDSNKGVRDRIVEALLAIEPERFVHLKTERKIE
jgi:HEAT repeat protein